MGRPPGSQARPPRLRGFVLGADGGAAAPRSTALRSSGTQARGRAGGCVGGPGRAQDGRCRGWQACEYCLISKLVALIANNLKRGALRHRVTHSMTYAIYLSQCFVSAVLILLLL